MTAQSQHVLQRVVLPNAQSSAAPLYFDFAGSTTSTASSSTAPKQPPALVLPPGEAVSLATYFNAFPAGYWSHHTNLKEIVLLVSTQGSGTLRVYRSDHTGTATLVHEKEARDSNFFTVFLPLNDPEASFERGGWYWFDLEAGDTALTLTEATWNTTAPPARNGKLSLGITTFNKTSFCVETLGKIAANDPLMTELDRVFVVDQGSEKLRHAAGFSDIQTLLADKLQLIEQPNLGGSGGFSRAMAETLERPDSDFVMLLDDDVELEPESILRALQFGRYTIEPTIVGGHMFDLLDKPIMHAWAETVQPEAFNWGPSFPDQYRHDFRLSNLRETPWMHERLSADYNGWWMCMIPKQVIAEIGLSLPVFIKWDDAEYGLRAKAAGFETVSMPGVGLWHVSWLDKDDTADWQAFFHTRNRIIAALIHSEEPRGGKLLQNSGRQDIKKLLNMQYYAVQLAVDALRAVLKGPAHLHETMATDMPAARKKTAEFVETRGFKPDDPDLPKATHGRVPLSGRINPQGPRGAKLALFTLKHLPLQWLRRDSEQTPKNPSYEFPKPEANWWRVPKHRSVLVDAADGSVVYWYRHDRAKFRRLLKESRALTRQIAREWDSLAKEYRAAMPEFTSVAEWQKTFQGR